MKTALRLFALLLFPVFAHSLDYSLATDCCFIHKKERIYLDGYFAGVAPASIDKKGFRGSNLKYAEGAGAIFINAYPAEDHALSFEFGYGYMNLDWDKNPAFKQTQFNDGVFSIGYITTAMDQWRWVVNLGVHANLDHFSLSNNTFYSGMIWGRLAYSQPLGIHIGVVGQSGVKSTYLFPILGLDWHFHTKWKINAVFPLDYSIHYLFAKHFSAALSYRSFGGWYRSFHRVGKKEMSPKSTVSIHGNGVDFGVYFNSHHLSAGVFGGANFGGWILLRNSHGAKPTYFHFDAAAYGGIKGCIEF